MFNNSRSGIIEQENAIDYDVNYHRADYRRCERVQEIHYIKFKTSLVKESSDYTINNEAIKCFELVNDKKAEYCSIIEDQKVESYQLIEDHDAKVIKCELIEYQKVENNANQLIKEIIESCELIEDEEDINDLIDYLEMIFNKTVEITFNGSPFKSLISDIRSMILDLRMDVKN